MHRLLLLMLVLPLFGGCSINKLQPPQYGTQFVQQSKVLGIRMNLPSSNPVNGSVLQLCLGYVTSTTLIIPVVSNVNTNGEVTDNKPIVASAPLATTFGVTEAEGRGGVKITDNIISGYENITTTNSLLAAPVLNRVGVMKQQSK
jgi:hypothetical protein